VSFYIHTHNKVKKTAKRIITVAQPFFVGRTSLTFMLMFFIAIIGVVYMVNFNNNATMGYQLTMLESERNALKNVREQQNIDLTRSQSIDFIRNSPRVRIMQPTYEVEYFDGKSELAYRR
jgi:hypothetical protein